MLSELDNLQKKLVDSDHYRIMCDVSDSETLSVRDGEINSVGKSDSLGVSILFVKDNRAYFYSSNSLDKIKNFSPKTVSKLDKNIDYRLVESGITDKKIIGKRSTLSVYDFAKEFANTTKLSEGIISNRGRYVSNNVKRIIISENTHIEQETHPGFAMFEATVKRGSNIRTDYTRLGISTALDNKVYSLIDENKSMCKDILNKLDYKAGLKGKFTVILNPDLSDLLAHEAIGHATESDLVYKNFSVLNSKLGSKLAPEFVNLVDDPTPKDDLFGGIYYDDEGFPARKKYLIKKGILNEYIMSSRFADKMDLKNNGGARCQNYNYLPIPRMTNTSFEAGNVSKDELIADTKKGVLLSRGSGGQVDPTLGVYQFGVKEAYLIDNGEITEKYVNLSFGGNILESLKNTLAVSKEVEKNQPGFCGKDSQSVPVGGFGPYLKMKDVYLG